MNDQEGVGEKVRQRTSLRRSGDDTSAAKSASRSAMGPSKKTSKQSLSQLLLFSVYKRCPGCRYPHSVCTYVNLDAIFDVQPIPRPVILSWVSFDTLSFYVSVVICSAF